MELAAKSPHKPTVAIRTLGCKLNQAESESLARRFVDAGYTLVSANDEPEIFILNTCTVTHIADRKCRQYLRDFVRRNPGALVLAVGCYADRDFEALSEIEGVDLIVGNSEKERIVKLVAERIVSVAGDALPRKESLLRTRPLVKIQEGCSHGCTYCIVPKVRGGERSLAADDILTEVKQRAFDGYQEVVLTGTRIGVYEERGARLEDLLKRILSETDISRIHLSSLQPSEITSKLIDLWKKDTRVCQHLHLALQSGSADVLARMNRGYTLDLFRQTVDLVREAMPDMAVTTDIIVGFPGETADDFNESYSFCKERGFADMHVFPYSPRPGTPAARMKGRVSETDKKERSRVMLELAGILKGDFRSRFIGRTVPVLWESVKEGNLWEGYTGNYIRVVAESGEAMANRLTDTTLDEEFQGFLKGHIL